MVLIFKRKHPKLRISEVFPMRNLKLSRN